MADGMYAALSGAIAQQDAMNALSDNLANIATVGFKGNRVTFSDVIAGITQQAKTSTVNPDMAQGVLRQTGNTLDLAFSGDGFFVVDAPQGERLTRQGTFRLRGDGLIENQDGYPVQADNGGQIRVLPGASLRVDQLGVVFANETPVARIRQVTVQNPENMRREAHGLWSSTNLTAAAPGETRVESGMVENSNVNAVHTMTGIIQVQRAYESHHRAMEMIRAMQQKLTNDVG